MGEKKQRIIKELSTNYFLKGKNNLFSITECERKMNKNHKKEF